MTKTWTAIHEHTTISLGSDEEGWTSYKATGPAYFEGGEWWADVRDADGDEYPIALHSAHLST